NSALAPNRSEGSMSRRTKYVFVTGGVVSSIGKGLASASIGALMEARGLTVTHMKLDPYVNVDPGTMSPYQQDRKSTRLNSSHVKISYAVFCLKKKKIKIR